MALGDTVRELLIKLGLLGQAEVKAGLESTTADIEKLGAAQTTAAAAGTSASTEQVAALKNVESALTRAQAIAENFGHSAQFSAEAAKVAYPALAGAIKGVEEAISRAQALGPIVPQKSIDALDKLKKTLAETTTSLTPHKAGIEAAGKSHEEMALRVAAGRGVLERWARAIEIATQSSNGFVAAIAKMALPLAAAAVGLGLFSKLSAEMNERGVRGATVADVWSAAMDALAISMGGTSKAAAEQEKAFEAAQSKMEGLADSARNFATSEGLLSAAGIDATKVFEAQAAAIPAVSDDLTTMGQTVMAARGQWEAFNDAINRIRLFDPALAKNLSEQAVAFARMGESGSAAFDDLSRTAQTAASGMSKFDEVFARFARGPKEIEELRKAFGTLEATTGGLIADFERLKESMTESMALEILAPRIAAAAQAARNMQEVIVAIIQVAPELTGSLQSMFDWLTKNAEGHDKVSEAADRLREKVQAEVNAFNLIRDSIAAGVAKYGDWRTVIEAILPEIEKQISDLEKLAIAQGDLSNPQRVMLDQYRAWRAMVTSLDPELAKLTNTVDAHFKAIADGRLRLAELNAAYEAHVKAVTEGADRATKAVGREADAVRDSIAKQITELRKEHEAGLVDNTEYFEKINALVAAQNLAFDAARAEREQILAKEQADLESMAAKHQESAEKIAKSQGVITDAVNGSARAVIMSSEQTSTAIDAMKESTTESMRSVAERAVNAGDSFVEMAEKAAKAGQDMTPIIRDLSNLSGDLSENFRAAASSGGEAAAMLLALAAAGVSLPGLLGDIGAAATAAFGEAAAEATPVGGPTGFEG